MATGDFTVTYDGSSVTFNQFSGDDLPRAYLGQAALEFSALGAGYATGPSRRQRKLWSIAAFATKQQVLDILSLFEAWDADRANSLNTTEVTVQDELLGSTVNATGFFTDPPVVTKLSPGNNVMFLVTFAITET